MTVAGSARNSKEAAITLYAARVILQCRNSGVATNYLFCSNILEQVV
jgi:hypothetical protein